MEIPKYIKVPVLYSEDDKGIVVDVEEMNRMFAHELRNLLQGISLNVDEG